MLDGSEFRLRQGFCLWQKRLCAAARGVPAPAGALRIDGTLIADFGFLFSKVIANPGEHLGGG